MSPPSKRFGWPLSRWATLGSLFFIVFSVFAAVFSRGQRSAWILMTLPIESSHAQYTFLGYSSLFRGDSVPPGFS